jgi:hypothetical protein
MTESRQVIFRIRTIFKITYPGPAKDRLKMAISAIIAALKQ